MEKSLHDISSESYIASEANRLLVYPSTLNTNGPSLSHVMVPLNDFVVCEQSFLLSLYVHKHQICLYRCLNSFGLV